MKSAKMHQILAYYDGPQVFEAQDSIGGCYVGVAIDHAEYDFLVVGTNPERLRLFRGGSIDLLSLIVDRPSDVGWQMAKPSLSDSSELILSEASVDQIDSVFLPAEGFYLQGPQPVPELVQEARQRNGLLMEVLLDPPEAVSHGISSDTLGQFLLAFQRMIKYSFRNLSRQRASGQISSSSHRFSVVGLKPGSVKVLLEAQQEHNLLGAGESGPALATVLTLINSAQEPEGAALEVYKHRGHLASAFMDFLDVLVESKSRVQVSCADALSEKVEYASLSIDQAQATRTRLGVKSNIDGEPRVVTGMLKKIDVNRGTWRLETDRETYSGQTSDDGPSLAHLVTDCKYEFSCIERIELLAAGRERAVLFLYSIQKAQE